MRRPAGHRHPFCLVAAPWLLALSVLVGGCTQADIPPPADATKPAPQAVAAPPPLQSAPQPRIEAETLPPPAIPGTEPPAPIGSSQAVAGEHRMVRATLLLPLSGPAAATGAALLNAAQLALFDIAPDNFQLMPMDTKGTAEGALAAAQLALAQKPDIILGPLFSAEAKVVGPLGATMGISTLSLSTDRTAAGGGTFVVGFLPHAQVERLVSFVKSQGMSQVAALAPSTDGGRAMVEALQEVAVAQGVSVPAIEYYDPAAANVYDQVRRFAIGSHFDAVLLPDEGTRLRTVASALAYFVTDPRNSGSAEAHRIRLLGTMLWAEDTRIADEPSLAGAWYPRPASEAHAEFEQRFVKAFGGKPPRIASLAYDVTALAAKLAAQPVPDFGLAALTNPNGFAGIDGIFRLKSDGTTERGLSIVEVARGPLKVVSPAPTSFEQAVTQ